jgi:hypothetical protein
MRPPVADIIWKPPEVEDHRLFLLSGLQSSTAVLSVDFPTWVKEHRPQLPSQSRMLSIMPIISPQFLLGLSLPFYGDRSPVLCTPGPTQVVDTDLRPLHAECSVP